MRKIYTDGGGNDITLTMYHHYSESARRLHEWSRDETFPPGERVFYQKMAAVEYGYVREMMGIE